MIKKISLGILVLLSLQCAEMQTTTSTIPGLGGIAGAGTLTNTDITNGLKQALEMGIQKGVTDLGTTDGFYGNSLVKIGLPEDLQKVDRTLRQMGLGGVADEGIKLLNRAAEDAVSTAAPIFTNAISQMNFTDAKQILLGGQNAATQYLQNSTTPQLVAAFQPKISQSLSKVGADQAWTSLISKYNTFTGQKINPDLTGYVTEQAVKGVFTMVSQKENQIRTDINSRTTSLLQRVFAMQD